MPTQSGRKDFSPELAEANDQIGKRAVCLLVNTLFSDKLEVLDVEERRTTGDVLCRSKIDGKEFHIEVERRCEVDFDKLWRREFPDCSVPSKHGIRNELRGWYIIVSQGESEDVRRFMRIHLPMVKTCRQVNRPNKYSGGQPEIFYCVPFHLVQNWERNNNDEWELVCIEDEWF